MKPIDVILIIIISAAISAALVTIIKKRNSGECCGYCSNCSSSCKYVKNKNTQ